MADRRAGRVPHVRDSGGGKTPRSRNSNGQWRAKRADTGTSRDGGSTGGSWIKGGLIVAAAIAIFKGLSG